MRRKLPRHLVWLEAFMAAVETGSLEGSARHLGVARSVISDHLKALEESLAEGHALLERGPGRRVKLTSRGERLYEAATGPIQELGLQRLRDRAGVEAYLRLGMNPTLSSLLLPRIARTAARAGIKLETCFGSAATLIRQALTRQLDLVLEFTPLPMPEGLQVRTLAQLPPVVLAPKGHALGLRKRTSMQVADLEHQPFVDWLRDDPLGGVNRARFETGGIAVREVARAESFLQLFELLRAFRACAITPDLTRIGGFPSDLRTWPLVGESPHGVEVVAVTPSGDLSPEAKRILGSLERHFRQHRRKFD